MKFSLLVMTPGKQEGKTIPISLAQFLVGRDPQCHIRPASPMISKRHCALIQRDGKLYVRDFSSTNGTLVNDQPIDGEVELNHDDKLKIGPLLFTVLLDASGNEEPDAAPSVPVSRPTPAPPTKGVKPGQSGSSGKAPSRTGKPAPGSAAAPTPAPSTKAPAATSSSEEDDIAAMLLSVPDERPTTASNSDELPEIPEGTTVMDLKVPPEVAAPEPPKSEAEKARDKDKEKAKAANANSASAAKSLLEKLMKRPRPGAS
jgi:pSer/pThr/pTyr-binding forkhead associated (FHA) protein